MFENEDAGAGNAPNDVGSLPTNAPAAPPIPVSPSPATSAPATHPAAQLPALTPSPAAPSRWFMASVAHSLIASALSETATGGRAVVNAQARRAAPDFYDKETSRSM